MNKRLIIIATGVGIFALMALTLLAFRLTAQIGNRSAIGSPAPDFELALYSNYRADLPEKVRLSDLRGRVVLINFWASWCLECKKEAPDLEATYQRFILRSGRSPARSLGYCGCREAGIQEQ